MLLLKIENKTFKAHEHSAHFKTKILRTMTLKVKSENQGIHTSHYAVLQTSHYHFIKTSQRVKV